MLLQPDNEAKPLGLFVDPGEVGVKGSERHACRVVWLPPHVVRGPTQVLDIALLLIVVLLVIL